MPKIILVLSEKEADWLHSYMQYQRDPEEEESAEDAVMRKSFFEITDANRPVPSGGGSPDLY